MSEKTNPQPSETKPPSRDEIVKAVLGLIGIAITATLGYLGLVRPHELSIEATKTAEARLASVATSTAQTMANKQPLQKIDFNYSDDPTNRGWQLAEGKAVNYAHDIDGYYGRILTITSTDWYGLDFNVRPEAKFGTLIEMVVKPNEDSRVYSHVYVQSKDGSVSKGLWLKFSYGTGRPQMVGSNEWEWEVFVRPNQIQGNWSLFRLDLKEMVANTVGKNGWSFSQLDSFRMRGNLSIAYIVVYE
jgi:hypothetical protein